MSTQLPTGLWKILSTTSLTTRSHITHCTPRDTHQLVMPRTPSQFQRTKAPLSKTSSSKEIRPNGSVMPSREREDLLVSPTRMEAPRPNVESMLMVPRRLSIEISGRKIPSRTWIQWMLPRNSGISWKELWLSMLHGANSAKEWRKNYRSSLMPTQESRSPSIEVMLREISQRRNSM